MSATRPPVRGFVLELFAATKFLSMKSLALAVTPAGHLVLSSSDGETPLEPEVAKRIETQWKKGTPTGLLHLGWAETKTALPPAFAFWRDLARSVVSAVCITPGIEALRERVDFTAPEQELEVSLRSAPPMTGGEYLSVPILRALQQQVLDALRDELRSTKGSVTELFASKGDDWHVVGRVHLHLAENKKAA